MKTAPPPDTSVDVPGGHALMDKLIAWELAQRDGWLSLPHVTLLGTEAATMLAWHRGTLALDGLHALDARTASLVGQNAGDLHLCGLRSLTPPAAGALARHRGRLALDGLESLTEAAAAALEGHRGGLSLGGLTSLAPPIATALARSRGGLEFRRISTLSVATAAALAKHQGPLWLDGILHLDDHAATALATHTGWLFLRSISTLADGVAAALGRHRGRLFLDGLRRLSGPAAAALADHRGPVSLGGVTAATGSHLTCHAPCETFSTRDRTDDCRSLAAPMQTNSSDATDTPAEAIGIAILGAGFAGLCMGIRLLQAGRDDFTIFEKAADLGGTWRDNTYPGCECDVPSSLYSYSFAQRTDWSRKYAGQAEILDYMRKVARERHVDRKIRFRTAITSAHWDDHRREWRLTGSDGRRYGARVLVTAVGGLHAPQMPRILGLEDFRGPVFHTARWRHDVDLAGRNVAVIGTGTSAAQVIPRLAGDAESLTVFQRSPPWVLPRNDRPRGAVSRRLRSSLPWLGRLDRCLRYLCAETAGLALNGNPRLVGGGQRMALRHLRAAVPDPGLRRKLTPRYALGCKRVVLSDDLYPALCRENVALVLEGIRQVGPSSIFTVDGRERPVDAIVLATGFRPFNLTESVNIRGRGGRDLATDWREAPRGYQGVAVAGYPNLFTLMGPNTALGHTSVLLMIEAQVRYIMRCLDWLDSGRLATVEVCDEAQRRYNDWLDHRFERTVWRTGGAGGGDPSTPHKVWRQPCTSWYVHATGRNHVIWPGSSLGYWLRMRRPDPADFLQRPSPPRKQACRPAA